MTIKRDIQAIIRKANDYVNADVSSMEGLKRHLTAWYCFTFNTTFKDPLFLEHSFEELLLLYFMYNIRNQPDQYRHITHKEEFESYEDWLKTVMGDDYMTEEEMADAIEQSEKKTAEVAKTLPDVITTDFLNPDKNE